MSKFSVETLLSKKWSEFNLKKIKELEHSCYPGIYLLAYTNKDLEDKKINISDIFYVGMSNSNKGVFQRLNQFFNGITSNQSHSAGRRFFKEYSKNKSYLDLETKKKFFVVFLSIPCKVNKSERTAEDLRKMGEVAKLEYDILAHIKERLGKEPELNKK